jgi:hypothetical protein
VRVALLVLALVCTGCGAVDADVGSREPLERYGIAVTPPPGWHVRLTRGRVEAANVPLGAPGQKPELGAADLYAQLFEYEPVPQATAASLAHSYADGRPKPFITADFPRSLDLLRRRRAVGGTAGAGLGDARPARVAGLGPVAARRSR